MATWQAVEQRQGAIPWYVWCAALAITSAIIGGQWDISWHTSIGRDTFWTPAHIAIYMCGILAGIACGYLILHTTFARGADGSAVSILGFRGPLGAFIAAWGGIAMLTSAPFDNWWHDAYGLDVKIVSPPHLVLLSGVFAIALGALILTLGYMNRASDKLRNRLGWIFLYVGGLIVVNLQIVLMEYNNRVFLHSTLPYRLMSILVPFALAGIARASTQKFAATIVTVFYTALNIGLILILPLFPAQPKLGPVYHDVTQFIPPQFPILLIVPAFCLDLLWQRTGSWNKWLVAAFSGLIFAGALLAVEWPFAGFLMSPASKNAFFGTNYFGYYVRPQSFIMRGQFRFLDQNTAAFWMNMGLAAVFAALSTRLGLAWGEWMKRVVR